MSNPLERTGLDLKELEVLNAALMSTRQKNDKICICGHGSGRHTFSEPLQEYTCLPPKGGCDCKNLFEVIKSTNTRFFVRKTSGNGNRHALILGMQSAIAKGATVEWIVPSVCARCHEEGPTAPCVVSPEGVIYDGIPERREGEAKKKIVHKLLCQGCREGTKELR